MRHMRGARHPARHHHCHFASEGRATTCDSIDIGAMPDPIIIDDQSCAKIALGNLDHRRIL